MITDIKDMTSFKWATVTAVSPLEIRLDGDSDPLALIPDTLVDPLELGVGSRVRVELSLRKVVIHGVSNGGSSGVAAAGDLVMTARTIARTGWMLCQGQSLLRSSFPRLFAAIGTTYGAADSTHFNLPDLRGRVPVGRDTTQTEFDVLGEKSGAKTHTLTVAEMPSHNHEIFGALVPRGTGASFRELATVSGNNAYSNYAGGGGAHNNLQPYIVVNYMIKL